MSRRKRSRKRRKSKAKTVIYSKGEIVSILGEEGPDYLYLYLVKENIFSLETEMITTNLLKKVEKSRKGVFFKIGKKI